MLVHCTPTPSIKFTSTHLLINTWVERGTVRVKYMYLAQEHDAVSTARANEPIAQSRNEHLNHVATTGWMWVNFHW